jgi:hypothetical protein
MFASLCVLALLASGGAMGMGDFRRQMLGQVKGVQSAAQGRAISPNIERFVTQMAEHKMVSKEKADGGWVEGTVIQAMVKRNLKKRQTSPTYAGLCTKANCVQKNGACQDPLFCGENCIDTDFLQCLVAGQFNNLTIIASTREASICNCMAVLNTCLDGLTAAGPNDCDGTKNLCSLFYLSLGNEIFGDLVWPTTFTCNQCENTPPNYVNDFSCQSNYFCDNSTSSWVCSDKKAAGSSCTYEVHTYNDGDNRYENWNECGPAPADILSNVNLECSSGSTCTVSGDGTLLPGDSCTTPTAAECITGTCTNNACEGFAVNSACNFTEQCAYGLYCSNTTGANKNKCVARAASGGVCTPGDAISRNSGELEDEDPCDIGLTCLTTTNRCGALFQGAPGTPCTRNDECAFGTDYCAPSGCAAIPSTATVCDPANGDNDCSLVGGDCECKAPGATTAQTAAFECDREFAIDPSKEGLVDPFFACMKANQCTGVTLSSKGCVVQNCPDEFKCYWDAFRPPFSQAIGNCIDFAAIDTLFTGTCQTTGGATTGTASDASRSQEALLGLLLIPAATIALA